MTELLTAAQMRAIEQAAIEAGEVTGLELMERAGVGAADLIETWSAERVSALRSGPFSRRPKATILCGPGNNGGDGLVIARILKRRGWWVSVLLMSEPEDRHADAAEAARRWLAAVPQVYPMTVQSYREATGADVVVDALFGAGLNRPIDGELLAILNYMQHEPDLSERLVAIDGPSSICLDSGRAMSLGSMASLTITFHRPKVGHFLADGLRRRGRLEVVDIGLKHPKPEAAAVSLVGGRSELEELLMRGDLPPYGLSSLCKGARVERVGGPHKYDRGHALVLSGGVGRGGAARLAARGALRVGAGLVTVGCPPAAVIENAARLDAVMLRAVDGAAGFAAFEGFEKVSAVCLGPGFGVGERCREMVAAVLAGGGRRTANVKGLGDGGRGTAHPTDVGVVLDADALTSFEGAPEALFSMLHEGCVLTPHLGEFRRLFPDIAAKLAAPVERGPAYSKVDAAREAAARAHCVVLLKGADTVIASPDGRASISSAAYERAAPWLATAGSGDVLAGFITGLLARGFAAHEAAETAAWLHVECALKFGPGLIAEDLPEQLPAVFRDLGL